MIASEIKTVNRPDGEICRLQLVRLQDWESLDFLRPQPAEDALAGLLRIYRQFLVPAAPWIFGQIALFRLPEEGSVRQLPELSVFSGAESLSAPQERLFAAAAVLRQGMQLRRGKPRFLTEEAKSLWTHLSSSGCADTVCGRLPFTKILPVSGQMGFLSACEKDASLKVNASFFIMDPFDCAAPFDSIGTPFGLCVKDGRVLSPPLYEREALLVKKNGAVSVRTVSLNGLTIRLCGRVFEPAKNAEVLTRLSCKKTRMGAVPELVITGNRVWAVSLTGGLSVPASGFVLRSPGLYGLPVSEYDRRLYCRLIRTAHAAKASFLPSTTSAGRGSLPFRRAFILWIMKRPAPQGSLLARTGKAGRCFCGRKVPRRSVIKKEKPAAAPPFPKWRSTALPPA